MTALRQHHPRSADRPALGIGISLLTHGALVAALALGTRWHTASTEAGVLNAELWSAVPQIAGAAPAPEPPRPAPPRPAPPPPPPPQPDRIAERAAEREAQIAREQAREKELERARQDKAKAERERQAREKAEREKTERAKAEREKTEREKAEREKAERERAQKEKAAADRAAKQARDEQLRRIQSQLGSGAGESGSGQAARNAGANLRGYGALVVAAVKPNIVFADAINGNPQTDVEVRVAPSGEIISRRIVKRSGNAAWDEAVLRAIDRTGTLPRNPSGSIPPVMTLGFKPAD